MMLAGDREGRSLLDKACRLDKTFREDVASDQNVQKALAALN
jgi:hypothetical protein